MLVLSLVIGTFASVFFLFSFSLAFYFTKIVCETLCKFLYIYARLICMFMQSVMINRKFVGISDFSAPLPKRFIFLLSLPLVFLLFWIIYRKQKQKRKSHFLGCFCLKTSVFVANNVLIFSDLSLYRANHTPPPVFETRRVGQLSSEIFYFLFFIFYFL